MESLLLFSAELKAGFLLCREDAPSSLSSSSCSLCCVGVALRDRFDGLAFISLAASPVRMLRGWHSSAGSQGPERTAPWNGDCGETKQGLESVDSDR